MSKCIYCQSELQNNFLNFFTKNNYCHNCFSKFVLTNKIINKNVNINNKHYKIHCLLLFEYNEYAKDYLYFYKSKLDISLCLLFSDFLNFIFNSKFNLSETTVTFIPSSLTTHRRRGFNQNLEFLKLISNIDIFEGPTRIDNIKQGKLSVKARVSSKHSYVSDSLKLNKTLIVFDDVITTGTTVKCFLESIDNIGSFENIYVVSLFHSKNFN